MKLLHLALGLMLGVYIAACADGGTVVDHGLDSREFLSGQVYARASAAQSARPLIGAQIHLGNSVTTTNSLGQWRFADEVELLQATTITVKKAGYVTQSYNLVSRAEYLPLRLEPVHVQRAVGNSPTLVALNGHPGNAPLSLLRYEPQTEMASPALMRLSEPGDYSTEEMLGSKLRGLQIDLQNIESGQKSEQAAEINFQLDPVSASAIHLYQGRQVTSYLDGQRAGPTEIVNLDGSLRAQGRIQTKGHSRWVAREPVGSHACMAVHIHSQNIKKPLKRIRLQALDGAWRSSAATIRENALNDAIDQAYGANTYVLTGPLGAKANLVFEYGVLPGIGPEHMVADPLSASLEWQLPNSEGSGLLNQGPNAKPLDPKTDCLNTQIIETGVATIDLKGQLLNNHSPMKNVRIILPEFGKATTTNSQGRFTFSAVPWQERGGFTYKIALDGAAAAQYTLRESIHSVENPEKELTLVALPQKQEFATELTLVHAIGFANEWVQFEGAVAASNRPEIVLNVSDGKVERYSVSPEENYKSGQFGRWAVEGYWNLGLSPSQTLTLTANDGTNTDSTAVTLSVVNLKPLVSVTSTALSYQADEQIELNLLIEDNESDAISWMLVLDGEQIQSGSATGKYSVPISSQEIGLHSVQLTAKDGDQDTKVHYMFVVLPVETDSVGNAPDTVLVRTPQDTIEAGEEAVFAFQANHSDRNSSDATQFECMLHSDEFEECSSPYVWENVPAGVHDLIVRARRERSYDQSPAFFRFQAQ